MTARTEDRPKINIRWEKRTVRRRARGDTSQEPWEWIFWRARLARFTFHLGFLPASILDYRQEHRETGPAGHEDSIWQLWTDFGQEDMEPMVRIGRCSEQEAFEHAEERIGMLLQHEAARLEANANEIKDLWKGGQFTLGL